ncbi:MAG TPA: DJ-1/PfpI family protein [Longimicrobiaceae bacterium]
MPPAATPYRIGIPVYQGVDLMDVAAPREVFSWMGEKWQGAGEVEIVLVAETPDVVVTRDGMRIVPDATFDELPRVEVMWVPGGAVDGLQREMGNPVFLDALRGWAADARWVTSVCEGALLLASAGLLDGYRATTHWAFLPCLRRYPGVTVVGGDGHYPRCVVDPGADGGSGTRVTGAGISSGIDEALEMVKLIAGRSVAESVQQTMQYFPDPPVCAPEPIPGACPLSG